ncbi:hypothetical protein B0T10DRAFT_313541 [Thelonectria olida]|uniref:Uncharacterized protein n=1 Tax=Thelonectria olida TaxID=1576542 RepID=A0A9P9AR90_9HYPO|nr:hypothetical protein B0T10DRAFT_313541 [Thelonectria olida]
MASGNIGIYLCCLLFLQDEASLWRPSFITHVNQENMSATCQVELASEGEDGHTTFTSLVVTETDLATQMIPAILTEGIDELDSSSTDIHSHTPASATHSTRTQMGASSSRAYGSPTTNPTSTAEAPAATMPTSAAGHQNSLNSMLMGVAILLGAFSVLA